MLDRDEKYSGGSQDRARPAGPPPVLGQADEPQSELAGEVAPLLLDLFAIVHGDRHPLDALLLSAIIHANITVVERHADLQLRYGTVADATPDPMRRPVSAHALSTSLRLPYESVRRRVRGLEAAGLCRIGRDGAVVPADLLSSAKAIVAMFSIYERLRQVYEAKAPDGAWADLPPPTVRLQKGVVPVRAVARLASGYVLRQLDLLRAGCGDLISALVILHLRSAEQAAGPSAALRLAELARRLSLPAENLRRRLVEMTADGAVLRVRGGYVLAQVGPAAEAIARMEEAGARDLRRLMGALSQLGVLGLWAPVRRRSQGGGLSV